MTHKVGIYVRISRDRVGAGLGVERQETDCRALAESLGWDVLDVYSDNDLSAFSGKRRENYERLLVDIEAGHVTAVIAWHVDRLTRSPVELERFIALCDPRHVPTHTVRAGELDLTTAAGRMTARITGAVARHESEQKGERVARQKRQAIEQGRWTGGRRPFGYTGDGMSLDPDEAAAIRDAARRVLAGESIRSVVRDWNAAGMPTTSGKPWDGSNVRQMLMRPRNAGKTGKLPRGTTDIRRALDKLPDAQWPPVLDREQWLALAAKLSDPARRTHYGTSLTLVGSGLYRCECGGPMRSGGLNASGRPRYACNDPERMMHLVRNAEPVDELVLGTAAGILDREGAKLLRTPVDLEPLREQLARLRARGEEIAALFADPDSDMTVDQFRIANQGVQAKAASLEQQIARHTAGSALAGVADADKPGDVFLGLPIDRQRAVLDTLMTVTLTKVGRGRRVFNPDSVRIEPK